MVRWGSLLRSLTFTVRACRCPTSPAVPGWTARRSTNTSPVAYKPRKRRALVDFAQFRTEFAADPDQVRIVWLFSMVLGHSRLIWGRFVAHQDLQTVLRCHVAAFEALRGVPSEVLYDRMRTAVVG